MKAISLLLRIVMAFILLQSLFFKFSGAAESIFIFSTLGMEPLGRYGTGAIELAASVMIFIPATIPIGAVLALGTMAGAIGGHLTKLGIEVQGDHGLLFGIARLVLIRSLAVLNIHPKKLPVLGKKL